MPEEVTLVKLDEYPDMYRCVVSRLGRSHTVEIPRYMLEVEPKDFQRGSDTQHIGIIACGTVLSSIDPDVQFHVVDRSHVNRAYIAASHSQLFGELLS
jgi:hypothetical protein